MFDLAVNRSRSTQEHYLNILDSTLVSNATYRISRQSVHLFERRRFLKVLIMNRYGGHVGHRTRLNKIFFPQPKEAVTSGPVAFEEMFEL